VPVFPSGKEVGVFKKRWNYASAPPHAFMAYTDAVFNLSFIFIKALG
jgi:hypothetical protein